MEKNQALCSFCSKPDDSIQVVCEARCLLCSRCQIVPAIRKLLIDNTEFSTERNLWSAEPRHFNESPAKKGEVQFESSSKIAVAISGSCPLCYSAMSASMLLMVQSYKEATKDDTPNDGIRLEENSEYIPAFLKKFKTTYENPAETRGLYSYSKEDIDIDAEVEMFLMNPRAFQSHTADAKAGKGRKPPKPVEGDNISAAARVNITNILEFTLDCYQGQWASMVKNMNDSMLGTLMKMCNRKKFSQKTNDYRAKGIIEFLVSSVGYELPELIFFAHLVGLQPKFTRKISAGWGQITSAALVAICFDSCLKTNELYNEQTTSAAGINEFRTKLSKCFHMIYSGNNNNPQGSQTATHLVQSNPKVISLKKALKIVQFLNTIRHPHWILAPLVASCTEYDSRLAWTDDSMAKLINILFYVALTEHAIAERGVPLFPQYEKDVLQAAAATASHVKMERSLTSEHVGTLSSFNLSNTGSKNPFPTLQKTGSTRSVGSAAGGNQPPINRRASPKASTRGNSTKSFLNASKDESSLSSASTNISSNHSQPVHSRSDLMRKLHPLIDCIWTQCHEKHPLSVTTQKSILAHPFGNHGGHQPHRAQQQLRHPVHHSKPLFLEYLHDLDYYLFTKNDKFYYSLDIHHVLEMKEASNLFLPINDFLYALILCWEREYRYVADCLERSKMTNLRRKAITCNFQNIITNSRLSNPAQSSAFQNKLAELTNTSTNPINPADKKANLPPMTSGEKHAITRLLYFYRHPITKEFLGIDWEEVEKKFNSSYYPFTLPRTLLLKSRIELNLLSEYLIKVIEEQLIQDEIEAKEFEKEQKEHLIPFHSANENDPFFSDDDNNSLISNVSINSLAKKRKKAGLLKSSDQSVGSAHSTATGNLSLTELNKQYIPKEFFALMEQADPADDEEDDLNSLEGDNNSVPHIPHHPHEAHYHDDHHHHHHQQEEKSDRHHHHQQQQHPPDSPMSVVTYDESTSSLFAEKKSPRRQLIESLEEDKTHYYENVEKFRKARIKHVREDILKRYHDCLSKGLREVKQDEAVMETKKKIEIIRDFDTNSNNYNNNNHEKNENGDGNGKERIVEEFTEKSNEPIPDHTNEYLSKYSNDPNISWKSRIIPYLNLSHSLNKDGDFLGSLSKTYSDASVKYLSMKNGNCTLKALDIMVKTYCMKWQMEYMRILQLKGNPRVSTKGADLIGKALQQNCKLIHINLNSMRIGDLGLRSILEGIMAGNGQSHLIRLDLKDNKICIAIDAFRLLGNFLNLKFLDLSHNDFTLDKVSQWNSFYQGIYPLIHSKLEYFSLAYNKIQDRGFQRIIEEIILTKDSIYYFIPIKVLDFSHCFITNKSKKLIELIIVNGMQRENDGNAYKKAFEYTQQELCNPDFDSAIDPITGSINLPANSLSSSKVHYRSKYTDQKISKVFFKPEMITILTHLTRRTRKTSSNNNQGDILNATIQTVASTNILRNSFMDNNPIFPDNTNNEIVLFSNKQGQIKRNIRSSFIDHLNSLVNQSENIILKLNHLQSNIDDLHIHLNSYYILTHLQSLLLHGNVITQNIWDDIMDYQNKSTVQVLFHEDEGLAGGIHYGNGIEDLPCYELTDYQIELHPVELKEL